MFKRALILAATLSGGAGCEFPATKMEPVTPAQTEARDPAAPKSSDAEQPKKGQTTAPPSQTSG